MVVEKVVVGVGVMGDSNQIWLDNPTGKIKKGQLCECCARYNSRNTCVHAIVIREDKLLLIKRGENPMKGWWALPAGYVDWDETLEECCLRELEEETSIKGEIKELLGVYSDPKRDEDGRQNLGIAYLVEGKVGDVQAGDDAVEIGWFDLESLPEKIAFDHRAMILDFVDKKQIINIK